MAEIDMATIGLTVIVSLLALLAAVLVFVISVQRPRLRMATPTPLPMSPPEQRGAIVYRSLTPSSLPRSSTHRPAPPVRQPVARLAALLTIHSGPLQGNRFPLARPIIVLGRSSLCDITLPDLQTSRQHVRLEWRPDGLYLVDMNSTNGTFINNRRIRQYRLRGGEQVQIGNTILTIQLY